MDNYFLSNYQLLGEALKGNRENLLDKVDYLEVTQLTIDF